jgi:hypothetical protein
VVFDHALGSWMCGTDGRYPDVTIGFGFTAFGTALDALQRGACQDDSRPGRPATAPGQGRHPSGTGFGGP